MRSNIITWFIAVSIFTAMNVSADGIIVLQETKQDTLKSISAQEFYALSESQQDSVLIAITKFLVLKHGPDWYSDSYPVRIIKDAERNENRFFIDFYFDKDINEYFKKGSNANGAIIDMVTLKPIGVYFGNDRYIDLRVESRSGEKEVIPFGPSPHQIKTQERIDANGGVIDWFD